MKLKNNDIEQTLNWIIIEITAGKIFHPKMDTEKAFNRAHDRCLGIVENYKNEQGFFQLEREGKNEN